jgi:sporulation protein YtfJ
VSDHTIVGLMNSTLQNIKEMVDVNTIVGDAITAVDGTIIIPVSKVSFGFASGGSDYGSKPNDSKPPMFGGGGGAGISITPIAFLVVTSGNVKLLHISENNNTLDKLMALVPDLFEKMGSFFKSMEDEKTVNPEETYF